MKKVIICQTPFQIIVALYIKEQYVKTGDQVDIVITNTFKGHVEVADKLREKKIFDNVFIVDVKDFLLTKGVYKNLSKLFYVLCPKKMMKKVWGSDIDQYDEMYCWNYDSFTASVRSYFSLYRKPVKTFIFDEGYISYFPVDEVIPTRGFMKIIELRNKLFGIGKVVRESIDGLLLFEPECLLYKSACPIYKIDRAIGMTKDFRDTIDFIFNAQEAAQKYDKKYIIFEENHPEVEDEKVFDEIINRVGKENIIIKLHPRRTEDRFSKKGIKTLGNDGVPWEAITFVGDFSNKVLIAIGSGSITSYRMLFGNNMKAYMLFRFIKPNLRQFDTKYDEFWNKIEASDSDGGIYMPKTENEFYKMLEEEKRSDSI